MRKQNGVLSIPPSQMIIGYAPYIASVGQDYILNLEPLEITSSDRPLCVACGRDFWNEQKTKLENSSGSGLIAFQTTVPESPKQIPSVLAAEACEFPTNFKLDEVRLYTTSSSADVVIVEGRIEKVGNSIFDKVKISLAIPKDIFSELQKEFDGLENTGTLALDAIHVSSPDEGFTFKTPASMVNSTANRGGYSMTYYIGGVRLPKTARLSVAGYRLHEMYDPQMNNLIVSQTDPQLNLNI